LTIAIDKPYVLPNDVVTFSATTSSTAQAVYAWSFGDGTTATGSTVTHRFAQTGAYSVNVTPSVNGCSATNSGSVTVNVVATKRRRAK
jgi:PKD repeat protein